MTIECSDKMGKLILSLVKDITQNADTDLYNEACEMVQEEQLSSVIGADLSFLYRGQHFELLNMVCATNQALRDGNYKNVLSDKYALFAMHNDVAEDKPDVCPDAVDMFLNWWFGSDFDLKPGSPVPRHVLDEIDRRWGEIQRTLYGNEAKQRQALDKARAQSQARSCSAGPSGH